MEHIIPEVKLANSPEGYTMPQVGFGVAAMEPERLNASIQCAVNEGFRLFDNAPQYGNEKEVGLALRQCGRPREELFIGSKLENDRHAYNDAIAACDASLKTMGLDYLDMYLIHFPMPTQGLYLEAWRAMEQLHRDGKVRVIGLSNFRQEHIRKLLSACTIRPMIDELEINPYNTDTDLREYCQSEGIHVINWFPLGGPLHPLVPYPVENFKVLLEDPYLRQLSEKYAKTPAQIALRWAVQHGMTPIPKSSNATRIRQNRELFDFSLQAEEMAAIDALNHDRRLGPNSDAIVTGKP